MRAQATEGYENMKKYIEEHGQEMLEEDKKREQQMLAEQKSSLVGFLARFGGGGLLLQLARRLGRNPMRRVVSKDRKSQLISSSVMIVELRGLAYLL